MEVIASNRVDLTPLVTHRVKLDDIEISYDLFSHQRDGVLKVAITPWPGVNSEECGWMAKIVERGLSTLSDITRALVNLTNRCVAVERN
jgi:hypothetical protein